jgi:micrococcal nuclease
MRILAWIISALALEWMAGKVEDAEKEKEQKTPSPPPLPPETGKVVRVIDGDSLVVKTATGSKEVRIQGVDCPEFGQPGAKEAKELTKKLALGETVILHQGEKDDFGRTAANLQLMKDGSSLAEKLAAEGLGHPDPHRTSERIIELSEEAQKKKKGVWSKSKDPETPWDYRQSKDIPEM